MNKLYKVNQNITGFRINIGSQEIMSLGTITHSINNYKNTKLIWINKSPSMNTIYNNKNYLFDINKMIISFLTNLDSLIQFNLLKKYINFDNILYIGLDNVNSCEKKVIKVIKNKFFLMDNIYSNNLIEIKNFIKNDPIHISFNINILDKSIPYKIEQIKLILDYLYIHNKNQIINIDIILDNEKYIFNYNEQSKINNNILYLFNKYI